MDACAQPSAFLSHHSGRATLTIKLNTGRFGVGRTEQIPVDGMLDRDFVASAFGGGAEDLP
jgi:hypothetical protein